MASDPRVNPGGKQSRSSWLLDCFVAPLLAMDSPHARVSERCGFIRLGLIGQMRFDEFAPRHRARAEPSAQTVDEIGKRARPLGVMRAFEFGLRGRERLGDKTGEAHEVDAEARVDCVL